jgi:hypothetical protein
MLQLNSIAATMLLFLISNFSNSQHLNGIQIKEKLIIEFEDTHSCMTQTRAKSKEEALYNVYKSGPVRYKLSNNGRKFTIFEKNEKNKWYAWGSYSIAHSFEDQVNGNLRRNFLIEDGSSVVFIPETDTGPLVIINLIGEELIYFVSK